MIRKLSVLAVSAILALVLLPASSAVAAGYPGSYSGCYSIKKTGNYNSLRLAVSGSIQGNTVAAVARESVTAACQKVNSIPVTKMYIDKVWLYADGVLIASGGPRLAIGKAQVVAKTAYKYVKCAKTLKVWARVHYAYYDGSRVRPFMIHGPAFSRC